ncbi:hypothetical protein MHYP_G00268540 [Metynnis hypsauchen]
MNTEPVFVISFSLVLLNLLQDSAAAVQKMTVTSGSTETFYCRNTDVVFRCACEKCWNCTMLDLDRIKTEYILRNRYKITFPDLTLHDSGCYRCDQWECEFQKNIKVLPEKDPSVVIGKSGGSVVMPCAFGNKASTSEKYWCREDQNGKCLKVTVNSSSFRIQDPQGTFSLMKQYLLAEDSGTYRCVVNQWETKTSHAIDLQVLQDQNGLNAPKTVSVRSGGQIKVACKYIQDYVNAKKTWQCYNSIQQQDCKIDGEVVDDRTRSELVLTIAHVNMSHHRNVYRCTVTVPNFVSGHTYWDKNGWVTEVDVNLLVTEPQIPSTTSAVTTKTAAMLTTSGATFSQNPLLYGIVCLLAIIAITLLIILLKLYCKRCKDGFSDRVQSPDLGGGTFYMNSLRNDLNLMDSTPQQPYTGCTDDSSSTSSESSGHSFGNISVGPHHQYLTIIPTPKDADYENIPEEMPSALPDYENVTADKDQDYVNVPEPQNRSSTEDQDDEAGSPTGKWKKSTASRKSSSSSESSSSDESEGESVNYSLVVFKTATEEISLKLELLIWAWHQLQNDAQLQRSTTNLPH